jgi:DNA-binding IclR family transcriptional regulator
MRSAERLRATEVMAVEALIADDHRTGRRELGSRVPLQHAIAARSAGIAVSIDAVRPEISAHAQRPMVTPFARALTLLAAFTPLEPWLGLRDLASRCGLPASTAARLAKSLVLLGYLEHSSQQRRYRLAAPVLALGYGALANSDVHRTARVHMASFAEQHKVHVSLSTRDRLDVVVLESCRSPLSSVGPNLHVGVRLGMVSSPIGWALLAALPELERYYLLEHVERRQPREWPHLRRRYCEGIAQVQQNGFCSSPDEAGRELTIVAAPVRVPGYAPLVLACVGASAQATRTRVQRELGPRLMALAGALQDGEGHS